MSEREQKGIPRMYKEAFETDEVETRLRGALLRLLAIKDSDIRIGTIRQASEAVDKSVHIGGALSAVIPLVSLFYGRFIRLNVVDPTASGQDLFVLSKGHGVASMACVYADFGYFDSSVLQNSRSLDSILNGHPGPLLPGVHVATGPLGQGVLVAEGFSIAGQLREQNDVFCLAGDGEMQEGIAWEAMMYAAHRRLHNLCLIVDHNRGQLDNPKTLFVPMDNIGRELTAFGWRTFDVDGTQYDQLVEALKQFKYGTRDGRPTAIVCHTTKGYGGFSEFLVNHKIKLPDELAEQEIALQRRRREERVRDLNTSLTGLAEQRGDSDLQHRVIEMARAMNLELIFDDENGLKVDCIPVVVKTRRAPKREKRIHYDASLLPVLDPQEEYSAASVITSAMKVFARDDRVVSVDADLSSTSGLEAGVGWVDSRRALNVGIAEANMMCIGEAFAVLGYNAWVSTFCPFFDWKVLRRIAIGHQERLQAIRSGDGWLSEGHGIDLTFLATAANFETQTNGATHMGNDDALVFSEIGHLKIIDVSCPNMLLGIMKWIMEGKRGLVYVRVMRSPSAVLYQSDFSFEYGSAYTLRESPKDQAVIISSGRGVHEAVGAARLLDEKGISVGVVDMPSIDPAKLTELVGSGKLVVVAEQNNGMIWTAIRKLLFGKVPSAQAERIIPINALASDGKPEFVHSATYDQLIENFGLSAERIASVTSERVTKRN